MRSTYTYSVALGYFVVFAAVQLGVISSSCLIERPTFSLPAFSIPLSLNSQLELSNINCLLQEDYSLNSTYHSPYLSVAVHNFLVSCNSNYRYHSRFLVYRGSLATFLNATIEFDLQISNDKNGSLPAVVVLDQCSLPTIAVKISVSGGLIANIVNYFSTEIENQLQNALRVYFCGQLATMGTELLVHVVDPELDFLVKPHEQKAEVGVAPLNWSSDYANWSSIVSTVQSNWRSLNEVSMLQQCLASNFSLWGSALLLQLMHMPPVLTTDGFSTLLIDLSSKSIAFDAVRLDRLMRTAGVLVGNNCTNTSSVRLLSFAISGLDHVKYIAVEAHSERALLSRLAAGDISITVRIALVDNGNGTGNGNDSSSLSVGSAVDIIDLKILLNHIFVEVDFILIANESTFLSLSVDQLVHSRDFLTKSFQYFNMTNMNLSLAIGSVTLSAERVPSHTSSSKGYFQLLNDLLLLVVDRYNHILNTITANLIEQYTAKAIKAAADDTLTESNAAQSQCASPDYNCASFHSRQLQSPYTSTQRATLFGNMTLFSVLDSFVSGNNRSIVGWINSAVSCVTGGSGTVSITTNDWTFSVAGLNSVYLLATQHLSIDSGSTATSHKTVDGVRLHLGVGLCSSQFSNNAFAQNRSNGLSLRISRGSNSNGNYDTTDIVINICDFALELSLMEVFDANEPGDLLISQLMKDGCAFGAIDQLNLVSASMSVSKASLYMSQRSWDAAGLTDITTPVQALLTGITHSGVIGRLINKFFEAELSRAANSCRNAGNAAVDAAAVSPSSSWRFVVWIVLIIAVAVVHVAIGLFCCWMSYRRKHGADAVLGDDASSGRIVEQLQDGQDQRGQQDRKRLHEQQQQPQKDEVARFAITVAILATTACFAASNAAMDAVVVIARIEGGGRTILLSPLFSFGLINTITEMWSAKVYILAILIAFFSGIWPYLKLLLLLVCWSLPITSDCCWHLTASTRGTLLKWVDLLGKLSLIDFFVMVIMMSAFHVTLLLAEVVTVRVTVEPRLGFYLFVLATASSLGLGHLTVGLNQTESTGVPSDVSCAPETLTIADIPRSIVNHAFTVHKGSHEYHQSRLGVHKSKQLHFLVTSLGKVVLAFAFALSIVLVCFGTVLSSLRLRFLGLTGILLGDESVKDYSFLSIGQEIVEASGQPASYVPIRLIQISYFIFGFWMPLVQSVICSFILFFPMKRAQHKLSLFLSEIVCAWSAIDVLVMALLGALIEIRQFAVFLAADKRSFVDQILASVSRNIDYDGSTRCFDVAPGVTSTTWIACCAAGLVAVLGNFSISLAEMYMRDVHHHKNPFEQEVLEANLNDGQPASQLALSDSSQQLSPLLIASNHTGNLLQPSNSSKQSVFRSARQLALSAFVRCGLCVVRFDDVDGGYSEGESEGYLSLSQSADEVTSPVIV